MEKILFLCVFSSWNLQIITRDVSEDEVTLFRVELKDRINLNCNMSDRYEIAWFHQFSQQLTQLISAKTSRAAGRKLLVTFNLNRSRLEVDADSEISTVTLVITGVTEADSGLYFCGTKSVSSSEMHFQKPIRLEIDVELPKKVDITVTVTVTERVLMFAGVGLAVCVFFLATVVAGGISYHRGQQKGWKAAKQEALMNQKSAKMSLI
ncbi:uncharacterized protein LOC130092385 isoform X1 [Rhinichthys klamathensis goyatoka]|uniref:uncharacterized protein LOC130092385 isoform X1 n=1 Tax=Rhinichthys klamathensis goyatoka TaxID=3034132 RepID=UPI0024B4FD29|nr:uncharacterized protein LOC130092385 isoform X1 [Rhinichthys klamathensis goyatoka]